MYSFQVWGNGHTHERIITPEAREVIFERWELFMPKRYPDGVWKVDFPPHRHVGDVKWSIGYGHTEGGDNEPFIITEDMELTKDQALDLLLKDMGPKMRWVNARLPHDKVPLTPYMFAALTSLTYQFGQGRLDLAQQGLKPDPDEGTAPLLVNGEHKAFPFIEQFHAGNYVDAFITILGLNFRQNGKPSKGLILRRASEVGFAMTRKDL